jgi:hypothetical protein
VTRPAARAAPPAHGQAGGAWVGGRAGARPCAPAVIPRLPDAPLRASFEAAASLLGQRQPRPSPAVAIANARPPGSSTCRARERSARAQRARWTHGAPPRGCVGVPLRHLPPLLPACKASMCARHCHNFFSKGAGASPFESGKQAPDVVGLRRLGLQGAGAEEGCTHAPPHSVRDDSEGACLLLGAQRLIGAVLLRCRTRRRTEVWRQSSAPTCRPGASPHLQSVQKLFVYLYIRHEITEIAWTFHSPRLLSQTPRRTMPGLAIALKERRLCRCARRRQAAAPAQLRSCRQGRCAYGLASAQLRLASPDDTRSHCSWMPCWRPWNAARPRAPPRGRGTGHRIP